MILVSVPATIVNLQILVPQLFYSDKRSNVGAKKNDEKRIQERNNLRIRKLRTH